MKHVKFIKHHQQYMVGEVASFQDEIGAKLITRGFAVAHDGKVKPAAKPEAAKPDGADKSGDTGKSEAGKPDPAAQK